MTRSRGHDLFRVVAIFAAVLCYATILLGGNVMASGDGEGCPHWPTCFPNDNLLPGFQGAVAVEWSHRVFAFFLSVTVLSLALLGVAFERGRPALLRLSAAALSLVVAEALLGGAVVESGLRPELVLAHLGIATVLFGLLLILVLLANLREMPKRWIDWARRASEEQPVAPLTTARSDPGPTTPFPGGVPAGPPPQA
ncbi:MAG TPA: COX15/CtaA family protein [Thermoplasmata archaeon]|nr:COX15/CtaA family protein [Thermoplasmata archaeon]